MRTIRAFLQENREKWLQPWCHFLVPTNGSTNRIMTKISQSPCYSDKKALVVGICNPIDDIARTRGSQLELFLAHAPAVKNR